MASNTITKDLGIVTAYAEAVAGGYRGTRAQFQQLLANLANSALSYSDLSNKPSINNVELVGNKSLTDLGISESGSLEKEQNVLTSDYFVVSSTSSAFTVSNRAVILKRYGQLCVIVADLLLSPESEISVSAGEGKTVWAGLVRNNVPELQYPLFAIGSMYGGSANVLKTFVVEHTSFNGSLDYEIGVMSIVRAITANTLAVSDSFSLHVEMVYLSK